MAAAVSGRMRVKAGMVVTVLGGWLFCASGARAERTPCEASPAPPASTAAPTMVNRPYTGLAITGTAILIPTYLLQLLSTLAYSPTIQTYDEPCSYCAKAQALNLIPIAGPWLAAGEAGETDDRFALAIGAVEAGAVALLVIGLIGHDVPADPEGPKVSLAPFVTPEAKGVTLHMRW